MTDRNIKVGVEVDASSADQGLDKLANKAQSTSKIIKKAGEDAGQGFSKVGEGSEQASEKIDRTSKSIIQSIQRTTVALESGGRTTAKYYETIANQRGVSVDALRPYLEQLKAVETAQGKFTQSSGAAVNSLNNVGISAKQTAAAMRNVPAQFTDIIVSLQGGQAPLTVLLQQGGQLKDMFGGIGNAAGALGKYILGLVNPYTVAAAAIGAVAFAYSKANDTAQEFAKTLIVSGNAAGTTTDQMISLANAISAAGAGSVKSANEAVNALVSTGKVSYSVLEQATLAVVKSQNLLGKSVEETSKEFADLAKSPTKSIIDLNEKYNFLTLDIYKQIKALEDQGRATEAAKLAQSTYAEVLLGNSAKVNETLTDWERGWNRIKKATSDAADAALRVFDQDTNEEQIKKLFKVRDDLEKSQTRLAGDKSFLNLGQADRVQAALDANKAEINAIRDKQKATLDAAKAQEEKNKADAAGIKFTEQGTEFLSKSAKMTRELDAATRLYLAGRTEANKRTEQDAELQTRLGQIREKYKETISKEENAYKSLSRAISEKLQLSILDLNTEKPLTEAQKLRVKLMEAIENGHGKITKAQIAEESRKIELIRSNELMKQSYEGLRKEIEKFKPAITAADVVSDIVRQDKAYSDLITTQEAYRQSLNDNADLMQLEASLMGQSATDRNTAIEQFKIELALKKELLKIEQDINLTQAQKDERSDVARENANIAKSQAALKVQQGEWSKFYTDIYNGLTDSLYRGFESGKGFFQSFWDGIKNLFKTTVLKLAVQGVMTGVLGMGANGLANAQGLGAQGGLSSISTVYSMGKSLWDGFSAAGTIGGGVTTLGNALGSSTLSAFGSGMSLPSSQAASAAAAYNGAGMTGTGTAISAGSSAAAAVPIVGWILAGMAANNSLFGQGWGGKASNSTKQLGIASGMVGAAFESTIQKMFGLSDKTASMLTGSAVVNRLFGYKTPELQQSELSANFGGDSVRAQIRDVFKQQGGVFRGDKWSETKNSVAGDQLKNLNGMFDSIKLAAAGYADVLGLSSDTIKNFTKEVKVNLSITGDAAKDAEANGKIWADLIGGVADDLSKYLMPNLADFAKEGEKSGDTFARIAANLGGVNAAFSDLNLTLFKASDVGIKAASNFVDLFGGLDKFQAASQSYYENFYTQEERNANVVKSLTAELEKQNLVLPSSRDGYRALVEEISKTGTSEQLASLFKLSDAFASVFEASDVAGGAITSFAQRMAEQSELIAQGEKLIAMNATSDRMDLLAVRRASDLAQETIRKASDDAFKTLTESVTSGMKNLIRAGDAGAAVDSQMSISGIKTSDFETAAGYNSAAAAAQAKIAKGLMDNASFDALNVQDVTRFMSGLMSFIFADDVQNSIKSNLARAVKLPEQGLIGQTIADLLTAEARDYTNKNMLARGSGIAGVMGAQRDLIFASYHGGGADVEAYNTAVIGLSDLLKGGKITQDEYATSLASVNQLVGDSIGLMRDESAQRERIIGAQNVLKEAGISSIAFYFEQIGKSVEELNKVAAETAAPLSQVTSAIGRLTSIADVFGMSANAAGGKESGITSVVNAQLVASAAAIAAGVITSADAAQAAKLLADKSSFAGVDKTSIRDISLIFEGLKQFDAKSFENSFMRMNDALNKGAITQEQYQDIFDQSLNTYQGLDASTKAVADAMEGLRKSMGGFADQLLIDKQKTTLTQAATMDELLRQYEVAKVAAMTGEASSVNKFQDLANQVLDVNKYGSRAEYNAAFGAVYRDARNLENVGSRQGENVVAELKNLNKSQTERIDKLEDALLSALVQIAKNTKDTVNTLELAEIA